MANQPALQLILMVFLFLFITNPLQNSHAFSLKMIHRDSPKSPLYRVNLTQNQKLLEHIQISKARIKHLASLHRTKNTNTSKPNWDHSNQQFARPKLNVTADYLWFVEVGIGSFGDDEGFEDYYLGFDTGSDLTWTQCDGCTTCFHQIGGLFKASQSSTYRPFSCQNCPPTSQCEGDKCLFKRSYLDESSLVAVAATECLVLETQIGDNYIALEDFIFGCGIEMRNFVEGNDPNNIVSGLLGMGYGDLSLWSQRRDISLGQFSHCFQNPTGAQPPSQVMYLRFGNDVIQPPNLQSTPLIQTTYTPGYYLTLQGISVANIRIPIDPIVFAPKPDGSGGCVIDSGSTTSYITSYAFNLLVESASNFIMNHNQNVQSVTDQRILQRMGLSLCFERVRDPNFVTLPTITFHFANDANFVIEAMENFVWDLNSYTGNDIFCLMIQESTEYEMSINIVGGYQQMNQMIIYDVTNGLLKFGPQDCSANN